MEPMFIKDIRPGLKSINVTCIVLEVGHPVPLKEQREVRTLKVADATACINLSVWDEPGQLLVPGDIVRLTNGYASIWRKGNCLTLYTGKSGGIDKIGEFCMVFNEQLNLSDPNSALVNPMPSQPPSGMPILNNGNVNNGGVPVNRTSATPQVAGNKTVARFGNEQPALGLQSSNKQSTNKTIQKANRGGPKSTLRTERR